MGLWVNSLKSKHYLKVVILALFLALHTNGKKCGQFGLLQGFVWPKYRFLSDMNTEMGVAICASSIPQMTDSKYIVLVGLAP